MHIKVYVVYTYTYILKNIILFSTNDNIVNYLWGVTMELIEIIERISKFRTKAGLSARELSLRIGKNEAYINRLEYRKNFEPSVTVISEIAEVCGSSLEEFFYYDINQYKIDKQLIDLLKNVPESKKKAFIEILSK